MGAADVIKSLNPFSGAFSLIRTLIVAVVVIILLFMIWVVVLKKSDEKPEKLSSEIPSVGKITDLLNR